LVAVKVDQELPDLFLLLILVNLHCCVENLKMIIHQEYCVQ